MPSPFDVIADFSLNPTSVNNAAGQVRRVFNAPLGKITGQVTEFQKSLDAASARVFAFGATAFVINSFRQAFQGLIKSTSDVEAALIDIQSVAGDMGDSLKNATEEFNNLREAIFDVARGTGKQFSEVAEAASELARQGLGAAENQERLSAAMILSRISGIAAEDAVKAQTAALAAYANQGLTAAKVTNSLVNIDRNAAVSLKDLADGFSRSASTAAAAGVSFDELGAIITAIQQITQRGGSVIGNSLKSIFTRLSRGKTIEDLKELGVQINATDSGIEKLKSLATALKDISDPTLASQIKELAGGVYQINQVSAALDDLADPSGQFAKSLADSLNAGNKAFEVNEQLQDSLISKINQLTVSFTELGSTIGEIGLLDTIKLAVDALNKFSNNISESISKGGALEVIFKGLGRVLTGPGLSLAFGAIAKIILIVGKFAKEAVFDILKIGEHSAKLHKEQNNAVGILSKTANKYQEILGFTQQRLALEQAINNTISKQGGAARGRGLGLSGGRPLAANSRDLSRTPRGQFGKVPLANLLPPSAVPLTHNTGTLGILRNRVDQLRNQGLDSKDIRLTLGKEFNEKASKLLKVFDNSFKDEKELSATKRIVRQKLVELAKAHNIQHITSKETTSALRAYNAALIAASQSARENLFVTQAAKPTRFDKFKDQLNKINAENTLVAASLIAPFIGEAINKAFEKTSDANLGQAAATSLQAGAAAGFGASTLGLPGGPGLALAIGTATITASTIILKDAVKSGFLEDVLFDELEGKPKNITERFLNAAFGDETEVNGIFEKAIRQIATGFGTGISIVGLGKQLGTNAADKPLAESSFEADPKLVKLAEEEQKLRKELSEKIIQNIKENISDLPESNKAIQSFLDKITDKNIEPVKELPDKIKEIADGLSPLEKVTNELTKEYFKLTSTFSKTTKQIDGIGSAVLNNAKESVKLKTALQQSERNLKEVFRQLEKSFRKDQFAIDIQSQLKFSGQLGETLSNLSEIDRARSEVASGLVELARQFKSQDFIDLLAKNDINAGNLDFGAIQRNLLDALIRGGEDEVVRSLRSLIDTDEEGADKIVKNIVQSLENSSQGITKTFTTSLNLISSLQEKLIEADKKLIEETIKLPNKIKDALSGEGADITEVSRIFQDAQRANEKGNFAEANEIIASGAEKIEAAAKLFPDVVKEIVKNTGFDTGASERGVLFKKVFLPLKDSINKLISGGKGLAGQPNVQAGQFDVLFKKLEENFFKISGVTLQSKLEDLAVAADIGARKGTELAKTEQSVEIALKSLASALKQENFTPILQTGAIEENSTQVNEQLLKQSNELAKLFGGVAKSSETSIDSNTRLNIAQEKVRSGLVSLSRVLESEKFDGSTKTSLDKLILEPLRDSLSKLNIPQSTVSSVDISKDVKSDLKPGERANFIDSIAGSLKNIVSSALGQTFNSAINSLQRNVGDDSVPDRSLSDGLKKLNNLLQTSDKNDSDIIILLRQLGDKLPQRELDVKNPITQFDKLSKIFVEENEKSTSEFINRFIRLTSKPGEVVPVEIKSTQSIKKLVDSILVDSPLNSIADNISKRTGSGNDRPDLSFLNRGETSKPPASGYLGFFEAAFKIIKALPETISNIVSPPLVEFARRPQSSLPPTGLRETRIFTREVKDKVSEDIVSPLIKIADELSSKELVSSLQNIIKSTEKFLIPSGKDAVSKEITSLKNVISSISLSGAIGNSKQFGAEEKLSLLNEVIIPLRKKFEQLTIDDPNREELPPRKFLIELEQSLGNAAQPLIAERQSIGLESFKKQLESFKIKLPELDAKSAISELDSIGISAKQLAEDNKKLSNSNVETTEGLIALANAAGVASENLKKEISRPSPSSQIQPSIPETSISNIIDKISSQKTIQDSLSSLINTLKTTDLSTKERSSLLNTSATEFKRSPENFSTEFATKFKSLQDNQSLNSEQFIKEVKNLLEVSIETKRILEQQSLKSPSGSNLDIQPKISTGTTTGISPEQLKDPLNRIGIARPQEKIDITFENLQRDVLNLSKNINDISTEEVIKTLDIFTDKYLRQINSAENLTTAQQDVVNVLTTLKDSLAGKEGFLEPFKDLGDTQKSVSELQASLDAAKKKFEGLGSVNFGDLGTIATSLFTNMSSASENIASFAQFFNSNNLGQMENVLKTLDGTIGQIIGQLSDTKSRLDRLETGSSGGQ